MFEIKPKLLEVIKHLSNKNFHYSDQCSIILKLIPSYHKLFSRIIPLLSKHYTFIGMAHGSNKLDFFINKQVAIASQELVTKKLLEINADFVGIEGFSGNDFSAINLIKESYLLGGNANPKVTDVMISSIRLQNNSEINGSLNYQKLKPICNFRGVENHELLKLCHLLTTGVNSTHMSADEYEQLTSDLNYFRGLVMIAKFIEYADKKKAKSPAMPIGQLHIEHEIREIIDKYHCNWTIIRTLPENYKKIMIL